MLDHHLAGYTPVPTEQGESGGLLTRFVAPHRPARYLKQGTGAVADDIAAEYLRLRWLQGRLPCPAIVAYASEGDAAALLTMAVPGVTAYEALTADPSRAPALIEAVAATLRALHALPVDTCPFEATLPVRLAAARARVHAGLVDEDDFGDLHTGWSASQVLAALERDLAGGLHLARVVTHGDFSLGNVLMHDGRVTGVIDVGRLGVADPYQDLAILHDNLAEFGDAAQAALWRGYGIAQPDDARRVAHLRLDELF
jgi:aminoglycoside 3'-phosphotransferase-1